MFSTKGRYALRMIIDLAEQPGDEFIPLKDIADRQGLSKKYMEIIAKELSMAGSLLAPAENTAATSSPNLRKNTQLVRSSSSWKAPLLLLPALLMAQKTARERLPARLSPCGRNSMK